MHGCDFSRPRNVIPRWRNFSTTVEVGELGTTGDVYQPDLIPSTDFDRRLSEWHPDVANVYSSDLLSSAIVADRHEEGSEVARQLLAKTEHGEAFQRIAAQRVLTGNIPRTGWDCRVPAAHGVPSAIRARIVTERQLLRFAPENPIAWTELAHAYTAIGQSHKAERCLQVACQLAPDNRFVLRSATRFWIHNKEPDHGLWLLRKSTRVRFDPWLLAAELATSRVCGQSPRGAKRAERMLDSERLLTIHFSELAAALGVLELEHGHMRRARDLFIRALQRPTENALTQAVWFNHVARHKKLEDAIRGHLAMPRSYEALAWIRHNEGRMDQAVTALETWLDDEPFASRPAIDGSYLATLALEDHDRAQRIAKAGLLANPEDYRLQNNLAVAQLHLDHMEDAEKTIARLPRTVDDPLSEATMRATRGLLAFRQGKPELGAEMYLLAADEARKTGLKGIETLALWTGALEAMKADLPKTHPLISRAATHELPTRSSAPALDLLQLRVEDAVTRLVSA